MHTIRMQLSSTNPVFLYVNSGEESERAEALLRSHKIPTHVVEGCLDDGWEYPLAQVSRWEFEGLEEIENLFALPCMR